MTISTHKDCSSCGTHLPISLYHKSTASATGIVARCIYCSRRDDKLRRLQPGYTCFHGAKKIASATGLSFNLPSTYTLFWIEAETIYNNAIEMWGDNVSLVMERINQEVGYEFANIQWIPHIINSNNRYNNLYLTDNITGITHTCADWSKLYNIKPSTIRGRLDLGWDVSKAIRHPIL